MILVIILVYVAISIALRLGGENEAKKIFVKLIVVALLVNFAPVFVGLIVDAANIVMNFFLEPLNTRVGIAGILNQSSTYMDILSSAFSLGTDIRERLGLLAAGAGAIIINFAIAGAFLIFAGIFLFRYLAIWILTILSPLAFVAWIVPYTKKIWDMWWNNLIQWSIIGIPIAFFLYLALGSFNAINEAFMVRLSGPLPPEEIGVIARLIPYAIVVIFLFLGFIIGLVTSAMGAAAIIAGGKAANKVAAQRIWVQTKKGTAAVIRAPGRLVGRLVKNAQERIEKEDKGEGKSRFYDRHVVTIAGWGRRIREASGRRIREVSESPVGQRIKSGFKGAFSLLGDMATAWAVGAGIMEKKKKERPTCPKCGNFVPEKARHCPHCGNKMPTCANCGRPLIAGAAFCQYCGTKSQGETPPGRPTSGGTPEGPPSGGAPSGGAPSGGSPSGGSPLDRSDDEMRER
jgi:RNA polymerase subunit RPABC4/transcription elongation factor Spt4